MQQVQKRGMKGAEAVYLTVGDNLVYFDALLCALPRARTIAIAMLVHLNKGGSIT